MKLLDIVSGPWAITPAKLEEIVGVYHAHVRGPKIDVKAIEARLGEPLQREEQGYTVENNVAVVPVYGVLSKKMNLLQKVSGGASTELIKRDIEAAASDDNVERIVLDVDSPGGSVDGIQELARYIFSLRGEIPIVAVANGQMTSAAYWIAAACDEVFASSGTAIIGSIGVICQHVDKSKQDEAAGVTRTAIYSGKYKNVGDSTQPLSAEDRATMQDRTDYMYSVFVSDVADFRGVSMDDAHRKMADGKIFIGVQAVDAGLVDGVSTLDEVVGQMASGVLLGSKNDRKEKAMSGNADKDTPMTLAALRADHPELVEAILAEGHATGFEKGQADESARVKAVFDASLPGHEALIQQLMFDGKTTGGEAAAAVLGAEKALRASAGEDLKLDAKDLDGIDASNGGEDVPAKADLTTDEGRKAAWEAADKATKAEFGDDVDVFCAYYKNADNHKTFGQGGNT